jgi:hypothetical protein
MTSDDIEPFIGQKVVVLLAGGGEAYGFLDETEEGYSVVSGLRLVEFTPDQVWAIGEPRSSAFTPFPDWHERVDSFNTPAEVHL